MLSTSPTALQRSGTHCSYGSVYSPLRLLALRYVPSTATPKSSPISHTQQHLHHWQKQQQMQLPSLRSTHVARITPFDQAWGTQIDGQSLASQLFAMSLFPYLGFLFHLHRSGKAPKLTLFGFYFLLAFVGATIPAGIYAKTHYGTSLANVDWLHGGAESLLTVTNLLIVLGLRQGIKEAEAKNAAAAAAKAEAVGTGVAAGVQLGTAGSNGGDGAAAPGGEAGVPASAGRQTDDSS